MTTDAAAQQGMPVLGIAGPAANLASDAELSAARTGLRRARHRVHGAALVLISRLVTGEYPDADAVVVDTTLRWTDPPGPTLAQVRDRAGLVLADDDIESLLLEPVFAAQVHQLLALGVGEVPLADLGWQHQHGQCWQHRLVPAELRSGTWRFVATCFDPAAPWACSYARADCPRCTGRGRLRSRDPLWLCGCTRDVR